MKLEKASEIRKEVKKILGNYGLPNSFSVRRINFSDLARECPYFVLIKNWEQCGISVNIENDIYTKTGAITEFTRGN